MTCSRSGLFRLHSRDASTITVLLMFSTSCFATSSSGGGVACNLTYLPTA
eukprot:jgi/Botrbrau1/2157/Bobra.0093s0058.1